MESRYLVKILAVACAVAVMCAAVAVYFLVSDRTLPTPPSTTEPTVQLKKPPTLQLLSIEERGEWMLVETTYGFFRYPIAFADLLAPEVIDQGSSARVQFVAQMAEESLVIYTLHYNEAVGKHCGTLQLSPDTEKVPVYVEFAEESDAIPSDWIDTFYALQETFNDVLLSMAEDSRFVTVKQ